MTDQMEEWSQSENPSKEDMLAEMRSLTESMTVVPVELKCGPTFFDRLQKILPQGDGDTPWWKGIPIRVFYDAPPMWARIKFSDGTWKELDLLALKSEEKPI